MNFHAAESARLPSLEASRLCPPHKKTAMKRSKPKSFAQRSWFSAGCIQHQSFYIDDIDDIDVGFAT